MNKFLILYKQKIHYLKWYILERTIHPELRLIRGLIGVAIVLVVTTQFIDSCKDFVTKLTVQDGKLVNA